jgi:hypothetical protein
MAGITVAKLLRLYSLSQQKALVNFTEFAVFSENYARQHIGEQPELISYLTLSSTKTLRTEITDLENRKRVVIINSVPDQLILVIDYVVASISTMYRQLSNNFTLSYPTPETLPKYIPGSIIEYRTTPQIISDLIEKKDIAKNTIYGIQGPKNIPVILFPSNLPVTALLTIALKKIHIMLKDEGLRDFFLRRLVSVATSSEVMVRNFFVQVVADPVLSFERYKGNSDFFFFWLQFCNFIKNNSEGTSNIENGGITVLQSTLIVECFAAYYREEGEKQQSRDNALHALEVMLKKPPYMFTYQAIHHFTDSKGVALINQYSEDELQTFFFNATLPSGREAPKLIEINPEANLRYYIAKQSVVPLIERFRNEARKSITQKLANEYTIKIQEFSQDKLLKDKQGFEDRLEKEVKNFYPILHELLTNDFLLSIYQEEVKNQPSIGGRIPLFQGNLLLPYQEILGIYQAEITLEVKRHLPIWYSIPILLPILLLIARIKKKAKQNMDKRQKKLDEETSHKNMPVPEPSFDQVSEWKEKLRQSLADIETQMVPYGSTLEQELKLYEEQWNKLKDPEAHSRLMNKVNITVESYITNAIKSAHRTSFDLSRIHKMADSIMQIPVLSRMEMREPLNMYIQYYVLSRLKKIK